MFSDNLTGSYLKQVESSSKKKLKNNEVILYVPDYIKTEKSGMLQSKMFYWTLQHKKMGKIYKKG